ncbi:MAG: cyclic nucleotide-binding domain-containing protein [Bdellovibrionota bacterium]
MAGKNIVLQPGEVLFKAGDASDGMYLIRSGELRVYLDQGKKEVALATVSASGMIGEMALFDKKPRSASVKALTKAEVTLISNEDFIKLMKQIPKWFVSLMGTLSGRLRDTNERLQRIEGGLKEKPFQTTLRILHVIALLWHKDGIKEGKSWQIEKKAILETINSMFNEDAEKLEDLLKVLIENGVMAATKNSYNTDVLAMANRAILNQFIEFMSEWIIANPTQPFLPEAAIEILECLVNRADSSAYDTFTVSLEDLIVDAKQLEKQHVGDWKNVLSIFKTFGDDVKLVKVGDGGLGLRTNKKSIKRTLQFHEIIFKFYQANLS